MAHTGKKERRNLRRPCFLVEFLHLLLREFFQVSHHLPARIEDDEGRVETHLRQSTCEFVARHDNRVDHAPASSVGQLQVISRVDCIRAKLDVNRSREQVEQFSYEKMLFVKVLFFVKREIFHLLVLCFVVFDIHNVSQHSVVTSGFKQANVGFFGLRSAPWFPAVLPQLEDPNNCQAYSTHFQ